jgi:hypothetical protein
MSTKTEDICVVQDFRLTEHQVSDGNDSVDTYFSIRDNNGFVFGHLYDDITKPLGIIFRMWAAEENIALSNSLF